VIKMGPTRRRQINVRNRHWEIADSGPYAQHIDLEKGLGEHAQDHQYIVTVPRQGYRFVASVKEHLYVGTVSSTRGLCEEDSNGRPVADHERLIPFPPLAVASRQRMLLGRRSAAGAASLIVPTAAGLLFWQLSTDRRNVSSDSNKAVVGSPVPVLKLEKLTGTGIADSPDGMPQHHTIDRVPLKNSLI
jgi:hypothetical protein